jgi:hypothetical protein
MCEKGGKLEIPTAAPGQRKYGRLSGLSEMNHKRVVRVSLETVDGGWQTNNNDLSH